MHLSPKLFVADSLDGAPPLLQELVTQCAGHAGSFSLEASIPIFQRRNQIINTRLAVYLQKVMETIEKTRS